MYLCELHMYIHTKPSHQTMALIHTGKKKNKQTNPTKPKHHNKTMSPGLLRSSPKLQFLGLFSHILLDLHPENLSSSNPPLVRPQAGFHQRSFKRERAQKADGCQQPWMGTAVPGRDGVTRAEQVRCFHSSQLWQKLPASLLGSLV